MYFSSCFPYPKFRIIRCQHRLRILAQIDQITHRGYCIGRCRAAERIFQWREVDCHSRRGDVEINAIGVYIELDLIQIRFELRLYHQCAIHRFFDRVIALLQQRLSPCEQRHGDGCGACGDGVECPSVEVFEDGELVGPGLVFGGA